MVPQKLLASSFPCASSSSSPFPFSDSLSLPLCSHLFVFLFLYLPVSLLPLSPFPFPSLVWLPYTFFFHNGISRSLISQVNLSISTSAMYPQHNNNYLFTCE